MQRMIIYSLIKSHRVVNRSHNETHAFVVYFLKKDSLQHKVMHEIKI